MGEPRSTFGRELRRRRLDHGLSLNGLAKIAFYSKGHLSKIENDLAVPAPDQAWQLDSILRAGGELARLLPAPAGPAPVVVPPSGLPNQPPYFLGREQEFATLVARLSAMPSDPDETVVCVIDGMAGVGKSALAVKVARALTGRFPDGCLFIDLHGHTGNVPPLTAAEALDRLLRRLDLPVPPDPDERSARFRDHLANRRILLVLDNAFSAEQVRPLIPPAAQSRTLITSRSRLSSLDEAFHLALDVLSPDDAAEFLEAALGGAGEQEHIGQIVELCDGLPLALTIMAARSRVAPIEELATSATAARDRLAEIEDGERSLRAAFEISYRALPAAPRQVLVMIGLHPGGDWTTDQVAALTGLEPAVAARHLEHLFAARFIERNPGRRFRVHDLVGDFIRAKAGAELDERARSQARHRLLAWALDMTARADELITPERYRPPVEPTHLPVPFADEASAAAWLAAEQPNLVAVCRLAYDLGADSACWRLAALLRGRFFLTKQWDDWLATHAWALAATERAGHREGEAMTRNNLGLALMELGRLAESDEQFRVVLDSFATVAGGHAWANALANHAAIRYYQGDHRESLRLNQEALAFYLRHGKERNAAITLRSIGLVEIELGLPDQAIGHLMAALDVFAAPGKPLSIDEVMTMNCLGEVWLRIGRLEEAGFWLDRALKGARDCRSPYEEARALRNLGDLAHARGRAEEAGEHWRLALSHFTRLGAREATRVADRLAGAEPGFL